MKVLITGSHGQLGRDVVNAFSPTCTVFAFGRDELDIANTEQVNEKISAVKPDIIIHCAAYTAVDLAETETDKAYQVNAIGTRNVTVAAENVGAKICYISTDYVFDGKGTSPYKEYDSTNPQGVYGRSKWAGEQLVQSLSTKYFIVRTSWVFGKHGQNFVKTMLKFGREKGSLKVVNDQIGSPTYTVDLAAFLSELVFTEKYGIYHASNSDICSWFDFAKEIFTQARVTVDLNPCKTEEFPRPAPRPAYSVMDHMAIRTNGFKDLPPWQDALKRFLREIGEIE
ncbi:dTDP-4-dehydrorhamnose reductase [Paenibacillus alkalitolerans]|uniref:dTDP-4-dehydrorhamnose reductase n=1 Tax=Paenibacillus alkalitolerans TaxID=2799335 RepID=UPI0018F4C4A7|nr:dTDP-4-dehydrorhamnose reductase [Paenibacillus alkalitolerans]